MEDNNSSSDDDDGGQTTDDGGDDDEDTHSDVVPEEFHRREAEQILKERGETVAAAEVKIGCRSAVDTATLKEAADGGGATSRKPRRSISSSPLKLKVCCCDVAWCDECIV